jgi:hypothetical protein
MNPKLIAIQQELKAPKSQWNDFSKYKYRNAEDILNALKPLLKEQGLSLILTDQVVNVGEHNYVKATAILSEKDTEAVATTSAYAREEVTLKGQIAAQITGGASSYARKYALNGMFLIDDSQDPDSQDNTKAKGKPENKPALTGMATDKQRETIAKHLKAIGVAEEDQKDYLVEQFAPEFPLTKQVASEIIDALFAE